MFVEIFSILLFPHLYPNYHAHTHLSLVQHLLLTCTMFWAEESTANLQLNPTTLHRHTKYIFVADKMSYPSMMTNLGCHLDYISNQRKPKQLGEPVREFLDWVIWGDEWVSHWPQWNCGAGKTRKVSNRRLPTVMLIGCLHNPPELSPTSVPA